MGAVASGEGLSLLHNALARTAQLGAEGPNSKMASSDLRVLNLGSFCVGLSLRVSPQTAAAFSEHGGWFQEQVPKDSLVEIV